MRLTVFTKKSLENSHCRYFIANIYCRDKYKWDKTIYFLQGQMISKVDSIHGSTKLEKNIYLIFRRLGWTSMKAKQLGLHNSNCHQKIPDFNLCIVCSSPKTVALAKDNTKKRSFEKICMYSHNISKGTSRMLRNI